MKEVNWHIFWEGLIILSCFLFFMFSRSYLDSRKMRKLKRIPN